MIDKRSDGPEKRRREDRRKVLKGAKAVFNEGRGVLLCRVRDLSSGGARLEFPPRTTLPDQFDLHVTGSPARHCAVRWYKANIAGVQFLQLDK